MIIAVLLWIGLTVLPGTAAIRILRANWGFWPTFAAAPTVGLGMFYLIGLAASRVGLPVVNVVLISGAVLLSSWLMVEAARATRRPLGIPEAGRLIRRRLSSRTPAHWASWGLLIAAVTTGAILWLKIMDGLAYPPGWDAMHHGFFIRQILDYQTLDSTTVLAPSATGTDGGSSFYPLLFNLAAAMVQQISGVPVSQVMFAGIAAVGAVFMPVTVFALARRIDPNRPLVAGLAAFIAPLTLSTYALIGTGRDNTVLGLALTLGTALALLSIRGTAGVLLAALSMVGIIGLHTSEMPIAVLLAGSVALVEVVRSRRFRAFARWVGMAIAASVVGLLLLISLEPTLTSASSARGDAIVTAPDGTSVAFFDAIWRVLTLGWDRNSGQPPIVQTLIVIGLLVPLARASFRPYLACTLAYLVWAIGMVGLFTASLGPFHFLASPWYGDLNRLAWTLPILGAIPAAVAIVATIEALAALTGRRPKARRRRRLARDRWSKIAPAAVALISAAALVLVVPPATAQANLELRVLFGPASADSRAAFVYLQRNTRPGTVVMDDQRISGSLWMYNDYGVPPLFGNSPYLGAASRSWKERMWLIGHLDDISDDPCVQTMLDKHHVAFVYYDEARIQEGQRRIEKEVLDQHREFRPAFTRGTVTVYRIDPVAPTRRCNRDVSAGIDW